MTAPLDGEPAPDGSSPGIATGGGAALLSQRAASTQPAGPGGHGPRGKVWATAQAEKNWLVVRLDPIPGRSDKLNKVPVLPTSPGRNASKDDAARHTFGEALQHANDLNHAAGGKHPFEPGSFCIGYLAREGSAMIGGDLDDCLGPDGTTLKPWAAEIVGQAVGYVERSPSGKGLRVLMARPSDTRLGFNEEQNRRALPGGTQAEGIGWFADATKYFTVTGRGAREVLPNGTGEVKDEPNLAEVMVKAIAAAGGRKATQAAKALGWSIQASPANAPSNTPSSAPSSTASNVLSNAPSSTRSSTLGGLAGSIPAGASGGGEWWRQLSPERLGDLIREALEHVPPDQPSDDDWLAVGMGVKNTEHPEAWHLFNEWCQRGAGYDYAENVKRWNSLDVDGGVTFGNAVLHRAQEAGWTGEGKFRFGTNPLSSAGGSTPAGGWAALAKARTLADMGGLRNPPLPRGQLIDGVFPCAPMVWIGPGGVSKSSTSLAVALHVITGRPVWGLPINDPGRVLIISREDDAGTIHWRASKLGMAMQLTPAEQRKVDENLLVLDLTRASAAGRLVHQPNGRGPVQETELVEALIAEHAHLRPRLVLIDPQNQFGAGEQAINDSEAALMAAGWRLSDGLGGACICYIHHTGKAQARERVRDAYAGRGGSAGADNARAVLVQHLVRQGDNDFALPPAIGPLDVAERRVSAITVEKNSYAAPHPGALLVRRAPSPGAFDLDLIPEPTGAAASAIRATQMAQADRDDDIAVKTYITDQLAVDAKLTATGLKERALAGAIVGALGQPLSRDRVSSAVSRLKAQGELQDAPLPPAERRGGRKTYLRPAKT